MILLLSSLHHTRSEINELTRKGKKKTVEMEKAEFSVSENETWLFVCTGTNLTFWVYTAMFALCWKQRTCMAQQQAIPIWGLLICSERTGLGFGAQDEHWPANPAESGLRPSSLTVTPVWWAAEPVATQGDYHTSPSVNHSDLCLNLHWHPLQ